MALRKKIAVPCGGRHERAARSAGFSHIAGVDEAGAGSLFGAVFAAAVVLCPDRSIRGLRDSKLLSADRRVTLAERIRERSIAYSVAAADAYEIDRINIYQARRLAMRRAIERLSLACDYILVDAMRLDVAVPQESIIRGDMHCQCIAAASILAKTARDEAMRKWQEVFPQYGLAQHKGYSTEEHLAALRKYGPTLLHRFSFEPVRTTGQLNLWTGYDNVAAVEEGTLVSSTGS